MSVGAYPEWGFQVQEVTSVLLEHFKLQLTALLEYLDLILSFLVIISSGYQCLTLYPFILHVFALPNTRQFVVS